MKDIIDIGFGSMIGMASEEIPRKIAHFVVDIFHDDSMKLKLSNGVISITPELVYKVLGVPLGESDVVKTHCRRLEFEFSNCLMDHPNSSRLKGIKAKYNGIIRNTDLSDFGYAIEDTSIHHESEYGNFFSEMGNSLNFNDMSRNYNVGECSHGVEELDNDFINETNEENGEDSSEEEMIEETEVLTADTLFIMDKETDPIEIVYSSCTNNVKIPRLFLESLAPGLKIDEPVIDALADLLNLNERYKSANSPSRYFLKPILVNSVFDKYLSKNSPQRHASIFRNVEPERMKMIWRTNENEFDSDVFLMSHMDNYFGQSESKWEYGFCKESKEQTKQLNFL
nr:hypothetical protein [Tanacetum cinerariifolium]